MDVNVYVDGFNLYYGALRTRYPQYKWLDVGALAQNLLPNDRINRVRYFTARISALPHDQGAPRRQAVLLRALGTVPNLTIHEGHFLAHPAALFQFPFVYRDPAKPPLRVQVWRPEEKGSDVNLATYLLLDCFDNSTKQP